MTLKKIGNKIAKDDFLNTEPEVPNLGSIEMSVYEQDELLSELLGNQLRRRAMNRTGSIPHWAMW